MKELDIFIKELNLVFTNTIKKIEFCKVGFNINNQNVNSENTISLYNLVSSFNKLYLKFKKDYETLQKLELGKSIEILDFNKINIDKDSYRTLIIYIDEPTICNHSDTLLYICEKDNKNYSFVTNNINPFNKNYYREDLKLDSEKCKKYLDLFEKYKLLLDTYKYLKNKFVFGDGTDTLFTRIKGEFLEELTDFEINFGQCFMNTEYYVKMLFNLGKNLSIDIDKCKIILDCNEISPNEKILDKLYKDIHINKTYLKAKER